MTILYWLAAMVAGALTVLQAGLNAELRKWVGSPIHATLISIVVSTVCVLVVALLARHPLPGIDSLAQAPRWAWLGGIVGVGYVAAMLLLAPKLGATALMGWAVAGQMFCSLVLDQFALAGFAAHPVSAGRIAGAVFLVIGVVLIQKY